MIAGLFAPDAVERGGGRTVTCVPGTTTRDTELVAREVVLWEWVCVLVRADLVADSEVPSDSVVLLELDVCSGVVIGSPIASVCASARATTSLLMSTDATGAGNVVVLGNTLSSPAFDNLKDRICQ